MMLSNPPWFNTRIYCADLRVHVTISLKLWLLLMIDIHCASLESKLVEVTETLEAAEMRLVQWHAPLLVYKIMSVFISWHGYKHSCMGHVYIKLLWLARGNQKAWTQEIQQKHINLIRYCNNVIHTYFWGILFFAGSFYAVQWFLWPIL